MFFYCFFVIRFFPASITPADGLFLIAIALGFGLLIAFLGGMGFFICKPLFEQKAQDNSQSNAQQYITKPTPTKYRSRTTTLVLAFSIILQTLFCLLYHESTKPNPETTIKAIFDFINESPLHANLFSYAFLTIPFAVYPICSFIIFRFGLKNNSWSSLAFTIISWALYIILLPLMIDNPDVALLSLIFGVLLWIARRISTDQRMGKRERIAATASVCGAALVTPFMYSFPTIDESLKSLPRIVFQGFGLYQKDIVLLAKRETASSLQALAFDSDTDISICNLEPNRTMINGAELLWHGLGSRSLVKVGTGRSSKTDSRLTLDSSTIEILSNPREICADLQTNTQTLGAKKSLLDSEKTGQIELQFIKTIEWANSSKWKLDRAEFIESANHSSISDKGAYPTNKARALCKSIELKLQELTHLDCQSQAVKFTSQPTSRPKNLAHHTENTKNTVECNECPTLFTRLYFRRSGV